MSHSRYASNHSRAVVAYPVRQSVEQHAQGLHNDHQLRIAKINGYTQLGSHTHFQLGLLHETATVALLNRAEVMLREVDGRNFPEHLKPAIESLVLKEIEEMAAHIRSGTNAAGWRIVEEANRPYDTTLPPRTFTESINDLLRKLG